VCDVAHALLLEQFEADARAVWAFSDGEVTPGKAREQLDEILDEGLRGRPAGISDEDWQLRVALGVA
jgi:hypothetical protein